MVSDAEPIAGRWFEGGAARSVPATLAIDGDGVAQASAGNGSPLASLHRSRLAISPRVGSIPRRIEFEDRGVFETADNDAIDRLAQGFAARSGNLIHGLEGFRLRLVGFVVLLVLLSVALYRYALPVMVEVAVAVTPPVVTDLMSRGVLASLDGSILAPSELDPARQATIRATFDRMTALASPARDYELNFRKGGPIGPNAFALPDGSIVLTDELVTLAGGDDEAIYGVLGHEIGHVEREHSLRQLYRAAGITGLVMLIGGDIGSGAQDVLVQGSALLSLSYSRTQESEADRFSVDLLRKAGKDPAALVRFFEVLRDKLGDRDDTDFLSTHPATPARIEEIKRYAAEASQR